MLKIFIAGLSITTSLCLFSSTFAKETGGGSPGGTLNPVSVPCLCTESLDACFARSEASNYQRLAWNGGVEGIIIIRTLTQTMAALNGYLWSHYTLATGVILNVGSAVGTTSLNNVSAVAPVCASPTLTSASTV